MSKHECRESREVPFSAEGVAWAAAAVGAVRQTVGKDVDAMGRLLPSPSRPLPYQQQRAPWQPARAPLTVLNDNNDVVRITLAAEVSELEQKLKMANRQIERQSKLIRGFCKFYA